MTPISPVTTISNVSSGVQIRSKSPSFDSHMSYMSYNSCHLMDIHQSKTNEIFQNDEIENKDSIEYDDDILTIDTSMDDINNWDPKHLVQSSKSLHGCDVVVK